MTRTQTVLLLAVVALVSLLAGQAAWGVLAPPVRLGVSEAALLVRSVPEAVRWVALSAAWWVPCAIGTRRCRRSSCSVPSPA